jgi:hypothetical protein
MQKFLYPFHTNLNSKTNTCKKEKDNIYILVTIDFFLLNEINSQKIIKSIHHYENYFYIFDLVEYVTYNELNKDDLYLESSNIINNNTNLALLTYKDRTVYSLDDYLSITSNPIQKYRLIIDSYEYLLSCIQLLLQYNLVHNNINANTICFYNYDDIKPILLKFNHSMNIIPLNNTIDYIKPYLLEYDPTNIYLPLEFHILSFIFSNKLESLSKINNETIINDIYNEKNMKFLLEKGNDSNIISDYKKEAITYFNTYINKSIEYIVKDIFNNYQTWDNYNLSIFFLEINLKSQSQDKYSLNSFIEILISNIHPNPNKRISIKNTMDKFKDLYWQ